MAAELQRFAGEVASRAPRRSHRAGPQEIGCGMATNMIWELLGEVPVPGSEMRRHVRGPAPIRSAVGRGWFAPRRSGMRRG